MKKIDWWNIVFSVFFIILAYVSYELLVRYGTAPRSVSVWDAFIMALATFRLTRLVVYDAIMRWFRDLFADAKEYTFRGTIRTLIGCPWCMGLWFALIVPTAYFLAPFLWFFIFVLALGGAATFIQLGANLVGWHAESKKIETLNKSKD